MATAMNLVTHIDLARQHADKRSDDGVRADAAVRGVMIGAIIILLILALGEFDAAGAGADDDADALALLLTEPIKRDAGVRRRLFGGIESHWHGALYAIFVLFGNEAVEVEIFNLSRNPAGEL